MKSVLIVCTGNICRSPLAEVVMQRELAEKTSGDIFSVSSAGTGAWEGKAASEGAYLVAIENSLDVSSHRATLLTRELVNEADLIFTMARHHRLRVQELGGDGKVFLLGEYAGYTGDQAEVADPYGGDIVVYRETHRELEALIGRVVDLMVAGEK
jgi:protein-tyrosine-phosphatase